MEETTPSTEISRVPTGQGKLEKVREFEWSGKVRESQGKCKNDWKVREILGKILPFCTVVVMLIIVELESNPPYYSSSSMAIVPYCYIFIATV